MRYASKRGMKQGGVYETQTSVVKGERNSFE